MSSEVDYRHIGDLMKVIEGSAGHPGKFNAIATAALAELADINAELAQEQAEARKEAEAKAAEEAAAKQAERDAQAEEQAKAARLQAAQADAAPKAGAAKPEDDPKYTPAAERRL